MRKLWTFVVVTTIWTYIIMMMLREAFVVNVKNWWFNGTSRK